MHLAFTEGVIADVMDHLRREQIENFKAIQTLRLTLGDQTELPLEEFRRRYLECAKGTVLEGIELELRTAPGEGLVEAEVALAD